MVNGENIEIYTEMNQPSSVLEEQRAKKGLMRAVI
jgi:hypothetical protein